MFHHSHICHRLCCAKQINTQVVLVTFKEIYCGSNGQVQRALFLQKHASIHLKIILTLPEERGKGGERRVEGGGKGEGKA